MYDVHCIWFACSCCAVLVNSAVHVFLVVQLYLVIIASTAEAPRAVYVILQISYSRNYSIAKICDIRYVYTPISSMSPI